MDSVPSLGNRGIISFLVLCRNQKKHQFVLTIVPQLCVITASKRRMFADHETVFESLKER